MGNKLSLSASEPSAIAAKTGGKHARRKLGYRSRAQRIVGGAASLLVTGAIVLVTVAAPISGATAYPDPMVNEANDFEGPVQLLVASGGELGPVERDSFTVKEKPKVKVVVAARPSSYAPAVPPPSPGTAQAYAKSLLTAAGLGDDQFACLVALWNRESHWNPYAENRRSGAYGIPQALPGSKMASAGADWRTNFQTQIRWGLGYINGRYGSPCGAWGHSQAKGWY